MSSTTKSFTVDFSGQLSGVKLTFDSATGIASMNGVIVTSLPNYTVTITPQAQTNAQELHVNVDLIPPQNKTILERGEVAIKKDFNMASSTERVIAHVREAAAGQIPYPLFNLRCDL